MSSPNPTKLTISINPSGGKKSTNVKSNKAADSEVEISISESGNAEKSVSLNMGQVEKNKGFSVNLGPNEGEQGFSVKLGPGDDKKGVSVSLGPGDNNKNVSVKLKADGKEKDITDLVKTNAQKSKRISNDKIGDEKFRDLVNLLSDPKSETEFKVKAYKFRKICPNILNLLTNQVRIPVSQRKLIAPILEKKLSRSVNIRDNDEFYLSLVDVIEEDLGIIAIFLSVIFPIQQTVGFTPAHYLSKAAEEFSPVKLAIKTYLTRDRIFEALNESGLSEVSELDRLGIVFYYGFHFGLKEYVIGESKAVEKKKDVEIEETKIVEETEDSAENIPSLVKLDDFLNGLDTTLTDYSDNTEVRNNLAKTLLDSATCLLFSEDLAIVRKLQSITERIQDWHKDYQIEIRIKDVFQKAEKIFGHAVSLEICEQEILEKLENIVSESEELVKQIHFNTFQLQRNKKLLTKANAAKEAEFTNSLKSEISDLESKLKKSKAKVQSNWDQFNKILESVKSNAKSIENQTIKPSTADDSAHGLKDQETKSEKETLKLEPVQVVEKTDQSQQELELKNIGIESVQKVEKIELKQTKQVQVDKKQDLEKSEVKKTEKESEPVLTKEQIEFDESNQKILAELIKEDFLAIAKQFALALERAGHKCEIPYKVLDFAAGCRISFENYDSSANKFQNELENACTLADANPSANIILFGSLLRPAILQPSTMAREKIGHLSLGEFSNCVSDLAIYLANLDFSFSPTLNELATFAGQTTETGKSQIEEELSEWVSNTLKRHGPCQPSTMVVHRLVRPGGDFGKVIELIKKGKVQKAEELAKTLIAEFKSHDDIYASLKERNQVSDTKAREFPNLTLLYIYRRIDEGRDLLAKWLEVVGKGNNKISNHNTDQKKIADNLEKLATEAINKLDEIVDSSDVLTSALGFWIRYQIEDTCELLKGRITPTWGNFDTARSEELDLLPIMTAIEESQDEIDAENKAIIEFLRNQSIPSVEDAISAHITNGAFRKAARLVHWLDSEKSQDEMLSQLAETRLHRVDQIFGQIEQKMEMLRELDVIELFSTKSIQQHLVKLKDVFDNLQLERNLKPDAIASSAVTNLPTDVDEISRYLERIDQKLSTAHKNLISKHEQRLQRFSVKQSVAKDKTTNLFENVELFGLPNLEDQVARIRDGRANEFEKSSFSSSLEEYLHDFASNSGKNGWPVNYREYDVAFRNNPIFTTSKERRDYAREVMKIWFEIEESINNDESAEFKLKEILQSFGFLEVVLRKGNKDPNSGIWLHTGFLRTPQDIETFVPPKFGSESNNYYKVVATQNSVPIDEMVSVIDADDPTILFIVGQLSESARKEITNRLRENHLNTLVIDETLAVYLAIRAEKKLEALFECGFSIGSINPYKVVSKVDIPPELFFGREYEIQQIVSTESGGVFVYGGKNSGKSAVLSQVQNKFHLPDQNQFVLSTNLNSIKSGVETSDKFVKLFAETIQQSITEKSFTGSADFLKLVKNIKEWINADQSRRLIFLFDDCDNFLVSEVHNNFKTLSIFKQLMVDTNYRFKGVFSGSVTVQRLFNSLSSTISQFGSAICIGQLNRTKSDLEAAYQMIVEPMQLAGFRFDEEETAENILSQLNYFPSLMHSFGVELVNHLNSNWITAKNGPPWHLSHDTLVAGKEVLVKYTHIREKFREMLDSDLRYKLIAYVMGYLKWQDGKDKVVYDGLSVKEIMNALEVYWPNQLEKLVPAELQVILDELFEIGVLGRFESDESGTLYSLRTNQLANLLGSENRIIEGLLLMEEIEPPHSYDPLVTRRLLSSKVKKAGKQTEQKFSPLTDFQLHQLVNFGSESKIDIVIGTDALGICQVCDSITEYAESLTELSSDCEVSVEVESNFEKYIDLVKKTPRSKNKQKLVVFEPKDEVSQDLLQQLEGFTSLKSGKVKTVLVLSATNPSHRELAKDQNVIFLRPWGGEMTKGYLESLGISNNLEIINAILAKSGGIPSEVIEIISQINPNDPSEKIAKKINDNGKHALFPLEKKFSDTAAILVNVSEMLKDSTETHSEIYKLARDEVSKNVGDSLDSIGPDLMSFGILEQFEPADNVFRVSQLGRYVAKQAELT